MQRFLVATGNIRSEHIYMAKVDDWTEFEAGVAKVCDLPIDVDMHARRLRLIGAALGDKIKWLIRFMEGKRPEVME